MAFRIVYLIRNGQYDRDQIDPVDEISAPLNENGRRQAALTAQAIRDLRVGGIHYSPYQQMLETAETISKAFTGVESAESRLLRQYDSLTHMPGDTLHPDVVRLLAASQKKQLDQAFTTFFSPNTDETEKQHVLICHGNIIRDLICKAIGVAPESWAHMMINNCSISSVAISPTGEKHLAGFNDIKHLPEALRTEG